MADEVVAPSNWRWYIGFVPAIGWDMVFQGPMNLMEQLDREDAPARFRLRKPSKSEIQQKQMHLIPWVPWFFGMIDAESEAVVARSMFLWIIPLTTAASEDAEKSWVKEPVEEKGLIVVDEEDAAERTQAAVAAAQRKLAVAREVKTGSGLRRV